jgi:Tfp pilus assembly protein PilF
MASPAFPLALKEQIMRFAAPALALSLTLAVTSSMALGGEREADPRAAVLIEQGRGALAEGDTQAAIDAFEAALTIDPGHTPVLLLLGETARAEQLQGKAIVYYRRALHRDPRNFEALEGEGRALLEKGAVERARENLAKLETLCGSRCEETQALAVAIELGPVRTGSGFAARNPESAGPASAE